MSCADLTTDCSRSRARAPRRRLGRVAATLACWRRRAVERRQLAALPPERWRDIARDPDAIRSEIAKPFWRP